jgi:hypothetical protein
MRLIQSWIGGGLGIGGPSFCFRWFQLHVLGLPFEKPAMVAFEETKCFGTSNSRFFS